MDALAIAETRPAVRHRYPAMSPQARSLWADMLRKRRERNALVRRLLAEPGGIVLAQQRRHDGSWMGCVITVSMEEPGRWRMTTFDADGFSGHAIRETREAAITLAVSEGYRDTDRDLLRRLSRAERFRSTVWGG